MYESLEAAEGRSEQLLSLGLARAAAVAVARAPLLLSLGPPLLLGVRLSNSSSSSCRYRSATDVWKLVKALLFLQSVHTDVYLLHARISVSPPISGELKVQPAGQIRPAKGSNPAREDLGMTKNRQFSNLIQIGIKYRDYRDRKKFEYPWPI